MLDSVNTAAQTEDLGEHKVQTELDRLTQNEIAAFAAARTRRNRAETDAAVKAALAAEAGSRYTAAELAAACGAALSLVLSDTRGMRLTPDDWSDLRSDLMLAAIERGQRCNLDRGEAPSLMPRREDLAGKDRTDGLAYLSGAARRLAADLAKGGAEAREAAAPLSEQDAAEAADATVADLTADDLAAMLSATERERWVIQHATTTAKVADVAAEHGKTLKGMEMSLRKGRVTLAAKTSPRDLRNLAAAARENPLPDAKPTGTVAFIGRRPLAALGRRNRPTYRNGAMDVLRYIAEAEAAIVEHPATLAEAADTLTRASTDGRRNAKTAPAHPAGMVIEPPKPHVLDNGKPGRQALAATIGPCRLTWRLADLPDLAAEGVTALMRASIARRYPDRRVKATGGPMRPLSLASDLPLEGSCPLTLPAEHGRPDGDRLRAVPEYRRTPMGGKVTSPAVKHPRYSKSHAGMLTAEVTAECSRRRLAELAAREAARKAERKAARKVTIIPQVER